MKKLIDLYPYTEVSSGVFRFLILLRSSKKIYGGQWRMIGGKVELEESYHVAALRELREETQLQPTEFWTIPSVNTFYEPKSNQIHHIPAFAARIDDATQLTLDDEHIDFKWIEARAAADYLAWPEQIRLMQLCNELLVSDRIIPQWRIDLRMEP